MPDLDRGHIELIAHDIARHDICYSHLGDELIDHVCCEVESEMGNGFDFADAYTRVMNRIGPQRFRKIQEETLYAVDTKYRNMKKTMKVSGIAGTIILGFAAMFKIQHWPPAGILLTLGAVTLAFVFMPSSLMVLWKESHSRKRLFLYISALMAGAFFIIGTLFKLQHWPGAGVILTISAISGVVLFMPAFIAGRLREHGKGQVGAITVLAAVGAMLYGTGMFFKIMHWPLSGALMFTGMVVLCLVAVPWYTVITWKDEAHISARFIYLLTGLLLVIVPGALINLNLQRSFDEGFYRFHEDQVTMRHYLTENNDLLVASHSGSPDYEIMTGLNRRTSEMIELIGLIQEKMFLLSGGMPESPVAETGTISGNGSIRGRSGMPFQPFAEIVSMGPGTLAQKELDEALSGYVDYINGFLPGTEAGRYDWLLDLSDNFRAIPGEEKNLSLISWMHSLELLKNGILIAERDILRSLAGNN